MPIPGISELLGREISQQEIEANNLFLLIGPRGAGKTTYCKSFFSDALSKNKHIIYISSNIMFKQFRNFFPDFDQDFLISHSLFINPFLIEDATTGGMGNELKIDNKLYLTLKEVERQYLEVTNNVARQSNTSAGFSESSKIQEEGIVKTSLVDNTENSIVVVVDSISHLFTMFEEKDALRYINSLALFLKRTDCKSIFTVNNLTLDENIIEKISTLFDAILEMRMEASDNVDDSKRMMRITSFTGQNLSYPWINLNVTDTGKLIYSGKVSKPSVICSVCKEPIIEDPVFHHDMAFHKNHLDVYIRLYGIYGDTGMTNIGQSVVLDANFFFVDIVGLSNPLLSVRKQIQKIELLNNLISVCQAFKKNSEKKVLPTGDGMVIGFISNPEAPLELSIQLHRELSKHNKNITEADSKLGIRIGLASGSVFVVNDINNNQNIWGPGIIFARRVMDIGDGWHILIEGGLAENLLTLDDKYKEIVHYIGDHQIKHGQIIKMYSAYDGDFGNSAVPLKFIKNT